MSFSWADLSSMLLSWILVHGTVILFVTVLLGAIGVPLPSSFLVLAAGAFIRQEVLNLPTALAWAFLGAILGDSLSYGLGRVACGAILRRYGESAVWRTAEEKLDQRGGMAIYVTRWLVPVLAVPINLVAATGGYPFRRFLLYGAAGKVTWLLLYGSLGYAFSDQWESISQLISNSSGLLVGALIVVAGVVVFLRKETNS